MIEPTTYEGEVYGPGRPRYSLIAVLPTVSPEEAREAMRRYQEVCEAVLTPDDYQELKERGKTKRFKRKSAVKKLQTFWSVSVRVRDVQRDDLGDGHFGFRVIATASMPGGREVEATGGCSTTEERFELKPYDDETPQRLAERIKRANARAYHDVMTTAETRATNRAVMNCIGVGGGEVTADEISNRRPSPPSKPAPDVPRGLTRMKRRSAASRPRPPPQATAAKGATPPPASRTPRAARRRPLRSRRTRRSPRPSSAPFPTPNALLSPLRPRKHPLATT